MHHIPGFHARHLAILAGDKRLGYGKLFHRPAAADAEIVSAVHAAADCDLAVRVEGQGSMLLVHTFQQYRAFIFRQETGVHRLMHNLAVGIDVGCEGRVAKSERHHADFGEMYRHAVWPMPDLPFKGYGKLFRHPTAVRRGVGEFRVAKHLHLPATRNKQAETAGRERDDAHVGERTERFRDGLIRRRVVLLSTAGELDVAVDRDDASDATQSEAVGCIWRFPLLGYGKLLLRVEDVDSHGDAIAQRRAAGVPCDKLKSFCRMTVRNHRDVVERRHFVFSVVHQL